MTQVRTQDFLIRKLKYKVVPPQWPLLDHQLIWWFSKGFFALKARKDVINLANIDDFLKLDVRVGKIVKAEDFPEARKPSYKLTIDFGDEVGIKRSSAQLVDLYTKEELEGKLVLGVVNLEPRQIGSFISESLTLGVPDKDHKCILITPDKDAPLGGKLY